MLEMAVMEWAQQNFGNCELGDERRTKRAVLIAAACAQDPSGTTPQQAKQWNDCRATYRFFNNDDVSFDAIGEPHWKQTCAREPGVYLILNDTTSTDFGIHRKVEGVGFTGDGGGRGLLLHSGVMVKADDRSVVGLAGQILKYRVHVPDGETRMQRLSRPRESQIWGELIQQIGPPPEGAQFIHVCDRGADDFANYCHFVENRCDWVVRVHSRRRKISGSAGNEATIEEVLSKQAPLGTYELSLPASSKAKARTAKLEIRSCSVSIPLPKHHDEYLRNSGITSISMFAAEVIEVGAPAHVEPLHWMLLTSLPVDTFESAWRVIEIYEQRPVIEEFHKALKTGCRLESRLYRTAAALEPLTAMFSILAVRLMQLRSVARSTPDQPAETIIPSRWIRLLNGCRPRKKPICTVYEFFRSLAGLGGHLGRKCDGEPGWITLWRGLTAILLMEKGIQAYNQKCG
jgi:hypothetical protein